MYRTIVVGTDGSSTAEEAVRQAAALAEAASADLHVVSAFRNRSRDMLMAMPGEAGLLAAGEVAVLDDTSREECEAMLRATAAGLEGRGIKVSWHAADGDAASAILDVAEAVGADLIVVGNRGMTGAKRFFLGSVPNRIAHHASCNVLIAHTC